MKNQTAKSTTTPLAYAKAVVAYLHSMGLTDAYAVSAQWLKEHGYCTSGKAGVVCESWLGDYSLADAWVWRGEKFGFPSVPSGAAWYVECQTSWMLVLYPA